MLIYASWGSVPLSVIYTVWILHLTQYGKSFCPSSVVLSILIKRGIIQVLYHYIKYTKEGLRHEIPKVVIGFSWKEHKYVPISYYLFPLQTVASSSREQGTPNLRSRLFCYVHSYLWLPHSILYPHVMLHCGSSQTLRLTPHNETRIMSWRATLHLPCIENDITTGC